MVEYYKLRFESIELFFQLLQSACAHTGGRVEGGALLYNGADYLRICGCRQLCQLAYGDFCVKFACIHTGEDCFNGKFLCFVFVHMVLLIRQAHGRKVLRLHRRKAQ